MDIYASDEIEQGPKRKNFSGNGSGQDIEPEPQRTNGQDPNGDSLSADQFEKMRRTQPEPLWLPSNAEQGLKEFYIWKSLWSLIKEETGGWEFRGNLLRGNRQAVERLLWAQLSNKQLRVYPFIRGRTLGWQKVIEVITTDHFINGVISGKKECW